MSRMTLHTDVGDLSIRRATEADFDSVHSITCEAADWIASHRIDMWKWVDTEVGRRIIRERIEKHEVYVASRGADAVATLCLMWEDHEVWGDRGADGQAGYVHGLAVRRQIAGTNAVPLFLEWAQRQIAANGRQYIRLDCMAGNRKLRSYYERLGFESAGIKEYGKWPPAALYEKKVKV